MKNYRIPYQLANVTVDRLCSSGILTLSHRLDKKKEPDHVFQLAVDSSTLTVAKFFSMYDKNGTDSGDFDLDDREEFRPVWNYLCSIRAQMMKLNYSTLVRSL